MPTTTSATTEENIKPTIYDATTEPFSQSGPEKLCPEDWILAGKKCLRMVSRKKVPKRAVETCAKLGANLYNPTNDLDLEQFIDIWSDLGLRQNEFVLAGLMIKNSEISSLSDTGSPWVGSSEPLKNIALTTRNGPKFLRLHAKVLNKYSKIISYY